MLCCIAAHDAKTRRIENVTVLAVAGLRLYEITLGAIAGGTGLASALSYSIVGAMAVLTVLLATAMIMERGTGSAGIGGGDVKLLAALGFCFGWEAGLATVGLSCLLMVFHQMISRQVRPSHTIACAFAPYIAVASMFTMLVR